MESVTVAAQGSGRLVAHAPARALVVPGVGLSARAFSIRYTTTTALGELIETTGTVLVPTRCPARLLVGHAVGNQGLAPRAAAVSTLLRYGVEYEALAFENALRHGFALAIPNYPGLGDDSGTVHPSVIGRSLGPAVLDCITAARQLPDAGLDELPVVVEGYSEGGCAAAWALELQPAYAPDLPVIAGAAGGVPADLMAVYEANKRGIASFMLLYVLIGLDSAYPDVDMERFLTRRGTRLVRLFRRTTIVTGLALGLVTTAWMNIGSITEPLPFDDSAVRARIDENRLGTHAPAVPTLLAVATRDQVIPVPQTVALAEQWRAAGGEVDLRVYKSAEHLVGGIRFYRDAMRHFEAVV
ncbi:MAG TPA: lipase family protein [Gordonia sp. (in: high G+C Gram-positive bacteria)]|uniref:lipase family protein n=1 Tax=Gordonia sp. UBA7599 TaxID=1946578 RepID=UPI0025C4F99B|nr:lipase family protein [Gordonia sp. UBA7599]HNP55931.1 lipase family protein [Gordonia sp. (in: high G+C Gram-positive bacteria)]HRC51990.1 lipase family protein [Gordonia sp. (in: high G+C Gram-positive bacteria)]